MGSPLYGLIIVGVIFAGAQLYARAMRSANVAANPGLELGAMAQALGLSIVRGDPKFHLVNGVSGNPLFMLVGVQKYEVDLLLEGAAYGRPVALSIVERFFRLRLRRVTLHEKFEHLSKLTVGGVRASGRFECWLEPSNEYLAVSPRLGLPVVHRSAVATGTLVFSAESPAVVAPVAPLLEQLAGSLYYLHVVGEGPTVALEMTKLGLHAVAPQLAMAKEALLQIAAGLEGQAVASVAAPAMGA